ncbi:glycoside hydrolase family 43 protein [Didymella exigua CBS 183.55]|uniref:Glycoside hydrolase family 43 protein n=1 Tax=Didymella exigua CBS 183.55 TaxID=1150837 RepID=A0A6A5RDP6_9PLEO|nr:glycoside hydrolase family 43 protein [Didymella exigua CBS 183.55]KAF1926391.1 glycoside hydrolase family 43 protein [Didymella exigua CBS 183.55]
MGSDGQVNPIIPGFAPDPSLVLVGDTYFLVNSTFHLFPGLPIYTSNDLVHWKHIGNAINRTEQLSLSKSQTLIFHSEEEGHMVATGGLYAPTIRYNNGTFYVICTNVIRNGGDGSKDETQNFILSTTDIYSSKWSDPVMFDFHGIDTSLFFDTDAKAYICGSKSPGPRTRIMLFEINPVTGEKLSEETELWNGTGGIYPEGPHIYRRNGFYYLMISEGGTYEDHRVVMARSRSILGPYEPYPENPILSAGGTDEYVQCTGHCEAFEDKNGEWWGVCLGMRMSEHQLYGLGRETFLVKGHWTDDGWLKFEQAKTCLKLPGVQLRSDERIDASAGSGLLYIRDPDFSRYTVPSQSEHSEWYELTASAHDLTSAGSSPTFIGKRQRLMDGASSVVLNSTTTPSSDPAAANAGLTVYKDEHRFLRIFHSTPTHKVVFQVFNKAKQIERSAEHQLEGSRDSLNGLKFIIAYTEKVYRAYFSINGGETVELGKADAMELSARDFVGPVVGIFAFANHGNAAKARFEGFVVDKAEFDHSV